MSLPSKNSSFPLLLRGSWSQAIIASRNVLLFSTSYDLKQNLAPPRAFLGRCTQVFHVWDLRVITNSDWGTSLLQSLFTCRKRTEGRWRKRQGHQCHRARLWGKNHEPQNTPKSNCVCVCVCVCLLASKRGRMGFIITHTRGKIIFMHK